MLATTSSRIGNKERQRWKLLAKIKLKRFRRPSKSDLNTAGSALTELAEQSSSGVLESRRRLLANPSKHPTKKSFATSRINEFILNINSTLQHTIASDYYSLAMGCWKLFGSYLPEPTHVQVLNPQSIRSCLAVSSCARQGRLGA